MGARAWLDGLPTLVGRPRAGLVDPRRTGLRRRDGGVRGGGDDGGRNTGRAQARRAARRRCSGPRDHGSAAVRGAKGARHCCATMPAAARCSWSGSARPSSPSGARSPSATRSSARRPAGCGGRPRARACPRARRRPAGSRRGSRGRGRTWAVPALGGRRRHAGVCGPPRPRPRPRRGPSSCTATCTSGTRCKRAGGLQARRPRRVGGRARVRPRHHHAGGPGGVAPRATHGARRAGWPPAAASTRRPSGNGAWSSASRRGSWARRWACSRWPARCSGPRTTVGQLAETPFAPRGAATTESAGGRPGLRPLRRPLRHGVRRSSRRNFAERGEVGAALCVLIDGRAVVDLAGGWADAGGAHALAAPTRWSTSTRSGRHSWHCSRCSWSTPG